MKVEVMVLLTPFPTFAFTYNVPKAHNMFVFMLDPQFKSLNVLKTFVGRAKVIYMVAKYDKKSLMPLLVVTFQFFNFDIDGGIEPTTVDDEDKSIFGVVT